MIPKGYKAVDRGRPVKGDLVFIPIQNEVYKVVHVDRMRVKVEREHEGSGLFLVLPKSQYIIVEKDPPN